MGLIGHLWKGVHLSAAVQSWPILQEAKDIGDEFLALEKFVNLNYLVSTS